jgi:hypothetical protein
MILRCATAAIAALVASLALGSIAMAAGTSAPPVGPPPGGPCIRPHPVCQIVNGQQVCTTPKPIPGCGGG